MPALSPLIVTEPPVVTASYDTVLSDFVNVNLASSFAFMTPVEAASLSAKDVLTSVRSATLSLNTTTVLPTSFI